MGLTGRKILIVEDDPRIANALKEGLSEEGYAVQVSLSGEDAFIEMTTTSFDLIVLDIMLPGRSGIEILKILRSKGVSTPVLILTARDTLEDRIQGLDTGADDYLVKPFAFAELVARIRALLRRGKSETNDSKRGIADLSIDLITRTAHRENKPLDLTVKEFDLLEYLLRHQGQLVSREMLSRDVWKEPKRVTSLDNVIDVHMARLRKKVDQDFSTKLIHTVRGVGFIMKVQ